MKHKILYSFIALIIACVLFFGTPLGTWAISFFQKTLAGIGQMTYTDEAVITDIKIKSLSKIAVTVESNAQTVVDRVYSVDLYLDDVKQTSMTVSWAGEIAGTKKTVTFIGLNLATTTVIDVEITY